jgi:GH25 family lysozyme M1 (1,4-beta-N-acetylmuramidase)
LNYPIIEKTGILVSYNKESNWFIPTKNFNEQKNFISNFEKENLFTGIYLDYSIDDELFRFLNGRESHKNIFTSEDGITIEIIPIRIKYMKIEKASDLSCETELREISYYFYDKLINYDVNSCVYISKEIFEMTLNLK